MKLWPWKRIIIERGTAEWEYYQYYAGVQIGEPTKGMRDWVLYKTINLWTGSETLKKVYLN